VVMDRPGLEERGFFSRDFRFGSVLGIDRFAVAGVEPSVRPVGSFFVLFRVFVSPASPSSPSERSEKSRTCVRHLDNTAAGRMWNRRSRWDDRCDDAAEIGAMVDTIIDRGKDGAKDDGDGVGVHPYLRARHLLVV